MRINLTDLILPLAGILIIASLLLKKSEWPVYKIPGTYFWFGGMTLALLVSLYTGFVHQGVVTQWGLYNKLLGWFVLLAYFLWGAWLTHNAKPIKIYKMFRIFACVTFIIGLIGAIIITCQDFKIFDAIIAYPFKGLMANRNAFGFLTISSTILIYFYGQSARPLLSSKAEKLFWLMLPLIHVQIGSRSCWILLILQILAFVFINRRYFIKAIAPALAIGCALVMLLSAIHTDGNFVFKQNQNVQFVQLPSLIQQFSGTDDKNKPVTDYQSDMLRLKVNGLAIELWAKSPILGTGLGTTQYEEPGKFAIFLDVVDSTPIWLLTETGLVGLAIFAAFFWLILFNLSRESEVSDTNTRIIDFVALGIFLTFAVMSVMHELLYTRFLWFILGIAITYPATCLRTRQAQKDLVTG